MSACGENNQSDGEWLKLGHRRLAELELGDSSLAGLPARVLGASDFTFETIKRDPQLLEWLLNADWLTRVYSREDYWHEVGEAIELCDDEAALMQVVRQLRKRHMVRVAWRDISHLADFDTIVAETSHLADALISHALEKLHSWAVTRRGTPMDASGKEQKLIVLALGKLGAGELNFSSDIDLIFAFESAGETQGGARSESNDEFFVRLSRRLIHVLDHVDKDGFAYRVDMRLRPFGGAGPLVTSVGAVEGYYETHGRDWERYALIRARVVAGDVPAGEALLKRIQPFIYRRYLDFGALESIREMKAMINAEVKRGGLQDNVKIGPGGIREIEFIAQAFQLVRGGRMPILRKREVRPVLKRLAEQTLLPGHAARDLHSAYEFLRTLEHRLQQIGDHQTHVVPRDHAIRERLAFAMGYADWNSLEAVLNKHRAHVREHFDQIFGTADESETVPETDPLTAMLSTPQAELDVGRLLETAGFREISESASGPLRRLLEDPRIRQLSDRANQWFLKLMPDLLRAAARTKNSAITLHRLCEVLRVIVQRSVYLSLLVERPLALSQLVRLCSGSVLIANHVQRYPLVIDEMLDSRTLYSPLRKTGLAQEFTERLASVEAGDLEQEMETLRREKQTNVLRVAAADLAQALPLMVVSDHLTEIAEVCVDKAVSLAWRDITERHGEPRYQLDGKTKTAGFAVIGYGKLGGIELSYGSDLDLVYLHNSHGSAQVTNGRRELDNEVFFARLAQRLVHILSARTLSGQLYEVDLRLRPSGASGLMVSSLSAFERYQRDEAWTWEHQALVRARVVCGDPELARAFKAIRAEILLRPRDEEALKSEVRIMRERMRDELSAETGDQFDLKQGQGGIADIEFLVQYLVLRYAGQLGEYLHFTDNIRLLEGIEKAEILASEHTQTLSDAYRTYRAENHRLALQEQPGVVADTEFVELRTAVSAIWCEVMEN